MAGRSTAYSSTSGNRSDLHWERYDTDGEEDLMRAYDQAMIETGIYSGRQVPAPGSDEEMEEYGWMEHCARRVSGPMRPDLGQVIRDQGYALE